MLEIVRPKNTTRPGPALQRAVGAIAARFHADGVSTRIRTLRQSGSAKLRLPRRHDGAAEAILINTAGGLTGGDEFTVNIVAEEGAQAIVSTQANERIYRSLGTAARLSTALTVRSGARLEWLPQETILFDGGMLERRLTVDLDEDASFLAVEPIILGRGAMGEAVRAGSFRDRWRVSLNGRLLFADDIRLDDDIAGLTAGAAALAGGAAMATIFNYAPDCERTLDAVREAIGDAGGASCFDGKLVARLVARDGFALRSRLIPALAALRDGQRLPRSWQQ